VNTICEKEGLNIETNIIENIQNTYQSDIRSIINFLQLNPTISTKNTNLITKKELNIIFNKIKTEPLEHIITFIHELSINYNIDKKNILLLFFSYLMRDLKIIEPYICDFTETIIHAPCINNNNLLKYCIFMMKDYVKNIENSC
jgi:DNA polymerase III delta prime subunit